MTLAKLALALRGTWRLLRLDAGGLDDFGDTIDDFWDSFTAAWVVTPVFLILMALALHTSSEPHDPAHFLSIQTAAYVINWVAFPLLMIPVCRWLGCTKRYFRTLAAYNWFHLPQIALTFLVSVVYLSGLAPKGPLGVVEFLTVVVLLVYEWFILVHGLKLDKQMAAGLVAVDTILSDLIAALANHFG